VSIGTQPFTQPRLLLQAAAQLSWQAHIPASHGPEQLSGPQWTRLLLFCVSPMPIKGAALVPHQLER
jgi:hypothetical protein